MCVSGSVDPRVAAAYAAHSPPAQLFCDVVRPQIMLDNPKMKMSDVSKVMSERWAGLDPVEKAKYDELGRQEKIKFDSTQPDHLVTLPKGWKREVDATSKLAYYMHIATKVRGACSDRTLASLSALWIHTLTPIIRSGVPVDEADTGRPSPRGRPAAAAGLCAVQRRLARTDARRQAGRQGPERGVEGGGTRCQGAIRKAGEG